MATINCPTTLECPALPRVTLSQAVIDLMESIALQESALSHILCAESQKMKTALAMNEIDLCKLLEVNDSATNMVHAVANLELVLRKSWSLSPITSIIPPLITALQPNKPARPPACPHSGGQAFCVLRPDCDRFV